MLKHVEPRAKSGTVAKARRLRQTMSLPEAMLWRALRVRPGGLKFRRQHPVGDYVLDFFCNDARLAIEVDGRTHDYRLDHDARRDAWLRDYGIETLRIAADDVLRDSEGVLDAIVRAAVARLPLHHPASPGGPPPRAKLGED